jgi:Ca2+-binding EF-hand superfamily protein
MSASEELTQTFKELDNDGDGQITAKEFLVFMTARGETVTREDLESIFNDADDDSDGLISYAEFASAWARAEGS